MTLELPSCIGRMEFLEKLRVSKNQLGYEEDLSSRLRELPISTIREVLDFPKIIVDSKGHDKDDTDSETAKEIRRTRAVRTAFSEQLYRVVLYHMIGKKNLDPFKKYPLKDLGIDDEDDDEDDEGNSTKKLLQTTGRFNWISSYFGQLQSSEMGVLSRLVQLQPTYVYEFLSNLHAEPSEQHMWTRNHVSHTYNDVDSVATNDSASSAHVDWNVVRHKKLKPTSGPIPFLFPVEENEYLIRSTQQRDGGEHYWFLKAGIKHNKKGHKVKRTFALLMSLYWEEHLAALFSCWNRSSSEPPPAQLPPASEPPVTSNIVHAGTAEPAGLRRQQGSFDSGDLEVSLLSDRAVSRLTIEGNDEIMKDEIEEHNIDAIPNAMRRSNRVPRNKSLRLDQISSHVLNPVSEDPFSSRSRGSSDVGMAGVEDMAPRSDSRQRSTREQPLNLPKPAKLDFTMVRRSYFSRTKVPVMSYTLPFPFTRNTQIEFLDIVFKVSELTDKIEIFDNEIVKVVVLSAWEQYGFWYHCFLTLVYAGLLASLSYSNYVFHSQNVHMAIYAAMTFTGLFLFIELKECTRDPGAYLFNYKNIPNYFQLLGYVLTLAGCSIRIHDNDDSYEARTVLSIATIILWINALNFLRPFSLTGPLVRMITYVILKLVPFFIILAVVLIGFSQGLYLLCYDDNNISSFPDFATPTTAYLHAFAYLTGSGTSYDSGGINPDLRIFLTVIFIVFAQACIWNLIIAFLNSCYQKIQGSVEANGMRERCNIVIDQFQFHSFGYIHGNRWLHYLKRSSNEQVRAGMSHEDIADEMHYAHHDHIEELQESMKQMKEETAITTARLSSEIDERLTLTSQSFQEVIGSSTEALKSKLEEDLGQVQNEIAVQIKDKVGESNSSLKSLQVWSQDQQLSSSRASGIYRHVEKLNQRIDNLSAQVSSLVNAGYRTILLKAAGHSSIELKTKDYSASELKAVGFRASDLKHVGYDVPKLKDAGYTLKEIREAGYSVSELRLAGYDETELEEMNK